jgi:ribose 5-phosphate isomerase B
MGVWDDCDTDRFHGTSWPQRIGGGVPSTSVRIAFGTDEQTGVTRGLIDHLLAAGHEVDVVADGSEWPEVGQAVGDSVAGGECERGIVCCWTGTGVSIAANKVRGIRAALCPDASTAQGARKWNDANVCAIGLRLTSEEVAKEIVDAFLATPSDPAEVSIISRVEPR